MITQVVSYICNEDQRDKFWKDIVSARIDIEGGKEIGNIRYNFFLSLENSDTILLVESWEDEKSLECHYGSENFRKLGVLKKTYVKQTIIEKYISNNCNN